MGNSILGPMRRFFFVMELDCDKDIRSGSPSFFCCDVLFLLVAWEAYREQPAGVARRHLGF